MRPERKAKPLAACNVCHALTNEHELLNHFGMSKSEINRQLAPMGTADEHNVAYLQMMQER